MAKQGQHKNDLMDQRKSRGPNNPAKSMTITTGTYKKRETYERQAREHLNTDPLPQAKKNHWKNTTHEPTAMTRARSTRSGRSGSDSNASSGTRGH